MGRAKGGLAVVAGLAGVWAFSLVVAGFAANGCQRRGVEARIGKSLDGKAAFASTSLSLLRGRFVGEGLTIDKEEALGSLRVRVRELDADLLPLGAALLDSRPRELILTGVELEATSLALFRTRHRGGRPFSVDALELRDVHLAAVPIGFLPSLGRLEVRIDRVRAGPTVLRTPLSWVFSLQELAATIDLPAGVRVRLEYANGRMRAQGGVFGSTPVEIPFALPKLDPARELEQLQELGLSLLERITVSQAESLLKSGWDAIKSVVP
jgi:hypothetical protein